ncbi:MAG: tRNA pseudouridine(55) synthase TruB [Candidatus Omnitrophica bacterium]|nr:tRNA pseudouridine(55) synthase TruB [Candidatus Omnitrophota bacterium]
MKEGILLIDKPQGITSHDVVNSVRRKLGIRRVGHAGTLDPIATGLLIVLVGKVTKSFNKFVNFDKEYFATLTLGESTDTGDALGKMVKNEPFAHITKEKIEEASKRFVGDIEQIPPMVSALKYKGKRLYSLAKKGISVPRESRKIKIYSLEIKRFCPPEVDFQVICSKGTYIRKLGEDIGEALGCCGHISKIRRIAIGHFRIEEAIKLEDVNESLLRSWPA